MSFVLMLYCDGENCPRGGDSYQLFRSCTRDELIAAARKDGWSRTSAGDFCDLCTQDNAKLRAAQAERYR